jgi:hypothetical protein
MKKRILIIIGILIVFLLSLLLSYYIFYKSNNSNLNNSNENISTNEINLDEYNDDITINKEGIYSVSGSFNHSIIIDSENNDVTLNLNGVTINSTDKAAIIGKSLNTLTINLNDESINNISASGTSDYDAAIWTSSKLIIDGTGYLNAVGNITDGEGIATETNDMTINNGIISISSLDDGLNAGGDGGLITINGGDIYINANGDGIDSNKNAVINGGNLFIMGSDKGGDAGIDTNDGYTINGGVVLAFGTDMLENPLDSSLQNSLCLSLDDYIQASNISAILDGNGNSLYTFVTAKKYKTLIISSPKLINGDYTLSTGGTSTGTITKGIYVDGTYTGGNLVSINNNTIFNVSKIVNSYGNMKNQPDNMHP